MQEGCLGWYGLGRWRITDKAGKRALVLPAACVIGGVGGAALDKHFHTGWIAVTGILLGAAAGFVQIYRVASGQMKRDE